MPSGAQTWTWSFDAREGTEPVLALDVSAHASIVPGAPPEWFDVSFAAADHPFRGNIETAWFEDDLVQLASALEALAAGKPSSAAHIVGGNRADELRLTAERVQDNQVVVEAWLTANGDDPVPALSFAFNDTRDGLLQASAALRDFLAHHQH